MIRRSGLFLALLLPFATPAQEVAKDPAPSTVSLRAQADREVANDLVVAQVAAEETGADPAALAASVNRRMAATLSQVRAVPAVKSRTSGYQTHPNYVKGRIEGWRVSQQLRLESADFAAMAQLLGQLQRELRVQSVSIGLSPEARRAAEDALIVEAVAAFHARAEIARKALKAPGYRLRNMDVGTSGGGVRPLVAMAREASSAAPVELEAGVSVVTVNVSGTVELR